MDTIIDLVTFNSVFHQIWFIGSMLLLFASCARVWLGKSHIFPWLCLGHAVVAFEALLMTLFRPGENEVFSIHCIWFNLLLAGVYYLLLGSPEVAAQLGDDATEKPDENEAER